jgi:hypothetical protein
MKGVMLEIAVEGTIRQAEENVVAQTAAVVPLTKL